MQLSLPQTPEGALPVLSVSWSGPMRVIASGPLGGGLGLRRWVLNAQVGSGYARRDGTRYLRRLAGGLGLTGRGVGMLTAADIGSARRAEDDGVEVTATVGLGVPILAADRDGASDATAGTINVVVVLPERVSDAALVNLVATVTEAKSQALFEAGLRATGTATDAVCVACPPAGRAALYGGPRSEWGSRTARAVYAAVLEGAQW